CIAAFLSSTRCNVTRHEVAERRIPSLEIVIAFVIGDFVCLARIILLLRNPNPSIIPQRFRHERELALVISGNGDTCRMNLRETWIREECSTLVRLPCSSHVAAHGDCTEIKYVTVSASAKQHGMTEEAFYFAIDEITCDDAPQIGRAHV